MSDEPLSINIRPPVSVYATYRRLSYKPWYAIAEFVDNSTQNFRDHKDSLTEAYEKEGGDRLTVKIQYVRDDNSLIIHDNANGMNFEELKRAVLLDSPPADKSGRSEFGMGLKTAACWFGRRWRIETTRLGQSELFTVELDIQQISKESDEDVSVERHEVDAGQHYTTITIFDLYKPIRGRTVSRIKDQLSSMYRKDIGEGDTEIWYNGTCLSYDEPPMLTETYEDGSTQTWKKELNFSVPWEVEGKELKVTGWVGIRNPGNQKQAGFTLFRRGRAIIGGPYSNYKPVELFGQGNTYRSQRLIGEIFLDEWPVTQAKDNFDWSGGLEDEFLEKLKQECKDYMDKAEGYRANRSAPTPEEMSTVTTPIRNMFESSKFSEAITSEVSMPTPEKTPEQVTEDTKKIKEVSKGPQRFSLQVGDTKWEFNLHWQSQISDAHWMELQFPQDHMIDIYLNSAHPFFEDYLDKPRMLELITKLVLSLALAEKMARVIRKDNCIDPADFRHNMNKVLKYASSIEEENQ